VTHSRPCDEYTLDDVSIGRLGDRPTPLTVVLEPIHRHRLRVMDASLITAPSTRRLDRVVHYVRSDLTRRPSLNDLALLSALEVTYLSKLFRLHFGCTFSAWSRSLRIERAKQLLVETDFSIIQIAALVGYSDVTTFERNFRKCMAQAPREFRAHSERLQALANSTNNAET
jgi:transcriptional regulator GlxA family with amidase domain